MANTTVTTSAVNKRAMLADAVLASMERQMVWENTVDTSFSSLVSGGGGQVLTIPKSTTPTAGAKSVGSDVTYSADTHGSITLTVDQHSYVAKQVEKSALLWTQPSMWNAEVGQFSFALSKKIDDYIESVIEGDTGSISDLGADDTFTSALVRTGMANLLASDVPFDGQVYLTVNSASYASLFSIADFLDASKYGDGRAMQTGKIGMLYGVQVFSSNSVSGTADADEAGYMYHKSAVIHARQTGINVEKQFSATALADQIVAHVVYGAVLAFGDRVYEYLNV